jgi:tetratricopeptide (TPR) repeat protein
LAQAQRPKPAFDPETKDGLLIEHILQERDPADKLRYLEQFAVQYPSHHAIAWVYDQLQPAYYDVKEYDQAMRIGGLRLAIEPDNLDAAKIALRAAEAKKDTDEMLKWADRLWSVSASIQKRGAVEPKQASEAKQSQDYAEFCLYTAAMNSPDLKVRISLLEGLEQRNPQTRYVKSFPTEYFRIYHEMGDEEKLIASAEKGLRSEPDNLDMLMTLTEFHFRKDNPKERQLVIEYAQRAIEVAEKKPKPEGIAEEEWQKKKNDSLAMAYYMGGMASSLNLNFRQADLMLRQALVHMKEKDNEAQLAGLLYHLGMANYRMAENSRDRSRPADALKFMRRCAAIKSPFQLQAQKNVDGIRAEYNLP